MQTKIIHRVRYLVQKANKELCIKCPIPSVAYMRSDAYRTAATANEENGQYSIRINRVLPYYADVMHNEVLPHEVAHIITFYLQRQTGRLIDGGMHHGDTWQHIAKLLGASGERHIVAPDGFTLGTHCYITSAGDELWVSHRQHKMMQNMHRVFSLTSAKPYVTITQSGFTGRTR